MRLSLTQHLKPLVLLWWAGVLVAGANFLATLLIVAKTSSDVYAAYTVGLSILMLASNWTDAGLASTLTVLATQSGKERERLERYKQIGFRYAIKIAPIAYVLVLGLTGLVFFQSQVFRAQDNFFLLAAFAVIGALTARTSFWNALLYASGNFKKSTVVQVAPAVARVVVLTALVIALTGLDLGVLLVVTLLPVILGWALARLAWYRTIVAMPSGQIQESQAETTKQVHRFLMPTLVSVVLSSLSYNVTLLGASFFTTGLPIATYGVFLRLNQIISMFSGVLIPYVARQLRLGSSETTRKRQGSRFIISGLALYLVYALLAVFAYQVLGVYVRHYSLDYPLEFALFLFYNGVGHGMIMLDAVLAAFGRVNHRLLGSAMLGIFNTALIPLVRPNSLLLMLTVDTLSILPSLVYYAWVFRQMGQDNTVNSSMTMEH